LEIKRYLLQEECGVWRHLLDVRSLAFYVERVGRQRKFLVALKWHQWFVSQS